MILILRDAWSLCILKHNILVTEVAAKTPPQLIMGLSKSVHFPTCVTLALLHS